MVATGYKEGKNAHVNDEDGLVDVIHLRSSTKFKLKLSATNAFTVQNSLKKLSTTYGLTSKHSTERRSKTFQISDVHLF